MASYLMPRPFPYNASRFRIIFRLHLLAIIGLALVALVVLRLSPKLLFLAYIFLTAMVAVIALTLSNAMWPVRTTHAVDGESVILRQGLGFRLAIPLSKVSKARRTEIGTGRGGIRLDRANGVLEVIAYGPEAVRLRLNEPVVHKGALVREVVVDVLEPGEFINCIRERKKGSALIERMDGRGAKPEPAGVDAPVEEEAPEEPAPEEPEPLEIPPPTKAQKPVRKQAPPPEPEETGEPEEPAGRRAAPPRSEDVDEIELVPALPSASEAPARVVRIPKRKA